MRNERRRRASPGWGALALLVMSVAAQAVETGATGSKQPSAASLRLRAAIRGAEGRPEAAADAELNAAIDAADRAQIDPSAWHVALALASGSALKLHAPERALQRARQVTALADPSLDDWMLRLGAAALLHQARDEVLSVTAMGHRWGYALANEPQHLIFQAAREGIEAGLEDEETEMLRTLFELRWHADPDGNASVLWRELALRLAGRGQLVEAVDVAAHVSDPYVLLSMYADNRFERVVRTPLPQGNVSELTAAWVKRRRDAVHQYPRFLSPRVRLARALLITGQAKEALDATAAAKAAARGDTPYEDAKELSWLYGVRADAFEHLGQFDAALAARQQAVMASRDGNFVHALNLAELLCRLNRPEEALAALSAPTQGGRSDPAFVAWIQLAAADERGDAAEVERTLNVLQTYEAENPRLLERALIVAGRFDAAASLYLRRLGDSSARRSDALGELQEFRRATAPPQVMKWRAAFDAVRSRPDVRAAMRRVGRSAHCSLQELIP